jgi:hypothetical protein
MNTESLVENTFSLTPKNTLENRFDRPDISSWLETADDPSVVMVSVAGHQPQSLSLEWDDITYGKRAYFKCLCGLRAHKLYLPHGRYEFKCRKCHGLHYQLTTFNRNSVAGRSLYRMNRIQKLIASRESMGRILYKGSYTKKFERFLGLCERAGYKDVVHGANALMALIKA